MSNNYKFFNNKPFYILLIEASSFNFDTMDWNNPNYVQYLVSQPFIKTIQVTSDTFFQTMKDKMNLDSSKLIVTQTIREEPDCNYQLLYIDSLNKKSDLSINNYATMLNINGELVRGESILIKQFVSSTKNEMYFQDMTSNELHKLLHSRGYTKVLTWNDESEKWSEQEVYGEMDQYAKTFFDEEKYEKSEIAFLKHNLNIWFIKSKYGKENVCGSLLNYKLEKVLIFTMLTDTIRGCITKDEIEKIIKLSTILTPPFRYDAKWDEEEKDEYNRTIIKNKYRVLDTIFEEMTNKNIEI